MLWARWSYSSIPFPYQPFKLLSRRDPYPRVPSHWNSTGLVRSRHVQYHTYFITFVKPPKIQTYCKTAFFILRKPEIMAVIIFSSYRIRKYWRTWITHTWTLSNIGKNLEVWMTMLISFAIPQFNMHFVPQFNMYSSVKYVNI